MPSAYAGARATMRAGDLVLFGQAMVVVDALDTREHVEAGVAGKRVAASVSETGRISGPLVEDNTIHRVGVTVQAEPARGVRLGVTGELPLEGDPLWRLIATGTIDFQ